TDTTKIVASKHDFTKTPPEAELVADLCRMQDLGADIVKYAVMPNSERDVLTLLSATVTMKEQHRDTPVITMSMGRLGVISRVCGSFTGSAVTFGTAGQASAPGQLPADRLKSFLDYL
ncbi:MAG: type I 3-dehydroquinate dehydratase, partial [Lachnospiraceae bacterium]|nr:type I 3-dehydroquinate dehydratase [Lachnospiraceae bacterium]